jgi:hypothetical protein
MLIEAQMTGAQPEFRGLTGEALEVAREAHQSLTAFVEDYNQALRSMGREDMLSVEPRTEVRGETAGLADLMQQMDAADPDDVLSVLWNPNKTPEYIAALMVHSDNIFGQSAWRSLTQRWTTTSAYMRSRWGIPGRELAYLRTLANRNHILMRTHEMEFGGIKEALKIAKKWDRDTWRKIFTAESGAHGLDPEIQQALATFDRFNRLASTVSERQGLMVYNPTTGQFRKFKPRYERSGFYVSQVWLDEAHEWFVQATGAKKSGDKWVVGHLPKGAPEGMQGEFMDELMKLNKDLVEELREDVNKDLESKGKPTLDGKALDDAVKRAMLTRALEMDNRTPRRMFGNTDFSRRVTLPDQVRDFHPASWMPGYVDGFTRRAAHGAIFGPSNERVDALLGIILEKAGRGEFDKLQTTLRALDEGWSPPTETIPQVGRGVLDLLRSWMLSNAGATNLQEKTKMMAVTEGVSPIAFLRSWKATYDTITSGVRTGPEGVWTPLQSGAMTWENMGAVIEGTGDTTLMKLYRDASLLPGTEFLFQMDGAGHGVASANHLVSFLHNEVKKGRLKVEDIRAYMDAARTMDSAHMYQFLNGAQDTGMVEMLAIGRSGILAPDRTKWHPSKRYEAAIVRLYNLVPDADKAVEAGRLSALQEAEAGRAQVEQMFPVSELDMPFLNVDKNSNAFTMLKTFNVKHFSFLHNFVWQQARMGNYNPMINLMNSAALHGIPLSLVKRFLTGRETLDEIAMKTLGVKDASGAFEVADWEVQKEELANLYLDALLASGGLAHYTEFLVGLQYGASPTQAALGAPVIERAGEQMDAVLNNGQNVAQDPAAYLKSVGARSFQTLAKDAWPLALGGKYVTNQVLPSDYPYVTESDPGTLNKEEWQLATELGVGLKTPRLGPTDPMGLFGLVAPERKAEFRVELIRESLDDVKHRLAQPGRTKTETKQLNVRRVDLIRQLDVAIRDLVKARTARAKREKRREQ